MAKVMKFPGEAIVPGSVRNVLVNGKARGFRFDLKLKYYRGLFLSCVDEFTLLMDGKVIDPDSITFGINGKEFPVALLPELVSEFWFITDQAEVSVRMGGGLGPGEHQLGLQFFLRSPYLPNFDPGSPNRYVQIDNSGNRCVHGSKGRS
jgi:hypothetical protein